MSDRRSLRILVGSVGLAGHALPALALARALRARGHFVRFHSFARWREIAEREGLEFRGSEAAIVELPGAGDPDAAPSLSAVARELAASAAELRADAIVGDALTLAPALAAELTRRPHVTLLPEVYPVNERGLPAFGLGLRPPRSRLGEAGWALATGLGGVMPATRWLRASRAALDAERRALGLGPSRNPHALEPPALVATLPALEYPRRWPAGVHVTGPMRLSPPVTPHPLPPGDEPLVFVAPSTVKDPAGILVARTLAALRGERVRIVVTRGGGTPRLRDTAGLLDLAWVDYDVVMRAASLVICHGNHGTVAHALGAGVPVLVCPAMDDDAEHGARVAWSGGGLMVPRRLGSPRALRAAARALLTEPRFAERAREIARANGDGAERGAAVVERVAAEAGA